MKKDSLLHFGQKNLGRFPRLPNARTVLCSRIEAGFKVPSLTTNNEHVRVQSHITIIARSLEDLYLDRFARDRTSLGNHTLEIAQEVRRTDTLLRLGIFVSSSLFA